MANLTKTDRKVLATIAEGMNSEQGYALITDKQAEKLTGLELVETNAEIRDGNKIAARLTPKGQTEMNDTTSNETTSAPAATASAGNFALMSSKTRIKSRRGGRSSSVYPFDSMEQGQMFFVPATDERPNPAKSLASTISSANKRYKEREGENARQFAVATIKAGEQHDDFTAETDGALVQRVDGAPAE